VGYAAAVAAHVDRLVLHHLAGPSGVVGEPGHVRPVFHVMRAITAASAAPLATCRGLPDGVAGLAWHDGAETRLLIANLREEPTTLQLDAPRHGRLLDAAAFEQATNDACWLDTQEALDTRVRLDAYAVLFASA
jgi:hypothetical protein